jgi:UPF0716 protein FxsA
MLKWMLLAFLAGGVALEVMAMLVVGGRLGVGWTLAWMAGTGIAGLLVLRLAGVHGLLRIHQRLREEVLPTRELIDMVLILFGAVCLILPGFVTDAVGLLLVLPPVRWVLGAAVCALYGDLLPPVRGPLRNAGARDGIIEITPDD